MEATEILLVGPLYALTGLHIHIIPRRYGFVTVF